MENKLDKLKKILEVSSRDTISAKEVEKFLVLVLTTIKKERELFNDVSDKQKEKIEKSIEHIKEVKNELSKVIDNSLEDTKLSFSKELQAVKDLIKNIELTPGKKGDKGDSIKGDDGYTPIKGVDYNDGSPDTGEQIVEKINDLPTDDDDLKIDASHIKNLPQNKTYHGGSSGIKEIIAGSNITVDNTNIGYPVVSATGGGGSSVTYFAETPSGTINSSNVTFTLDNIPTSNACVVVILNGLTQYNGIDYTVSGSTITFVSAPATGSSIFAYYNGTVSPPSYYLLENGVDMYLLENGVDMYLLE